MVRMKEESRAVFLGRDTVFFGWVSIENNTVYTRVPNKKLPFLFKKLPVLSNVKDHMEDYEERTLISLNEGRTDNKVRIFPFDLDTFEPYFSSMNPSIKRRIKSLEKERDFLFQYAKELEEIVNLTGNQDLLKRKFKTEYDFYQNLRPGYTFNTQPEKKTKKGA